MVTGSSLPAPATGAWASSALCQLSIDWTLFTGLTGSFSKIVSGSDAIFVVFSVNVSRESTYVRQIALAYKNCPTASKENAESWFPQRMVTKRRRKCVFFSTVITLKKRFIHQRKSYFRSTGLFLPVLSKGHFDSFKTNHPARSADSAPWFLCETHLNASTCTTAKGIQLNVLYMVTDLNVRWYVHSQVTKNHCV